MLRSYLEYGQAPTLEELSNALGRAETNVQQDLRTLADRGVLSLDGDEGAVIGAAQPFSSDPTPHRVVLAGDRERFAVNALDALGIPLLAGGDGEVHSRCAATEAELRLTVRERRLMEQSPPGIVVVAGPAVKNALLMGHRRESSFVISIREARRWAKAHGKDARILSLGRAVRLARRIYDEEMEPKPTHGPARSRAGGNE